MVTQADRTLKIRLARLQVILGDLFAVADAPPSHLSADALLELVERLERVRDATQSAEDWASFALAASAAGDEVKSAQEARAAAQEALLTAEKEIAALKRRLSQADRDRHELQVKADRLQELEATSVRIENAHRLHAASQSAAHTVASPPAAEVAVLQSRLELYRAAREDHEIEIAQLKANLASMKSRAEAAESLVQASSAEAQQEARVLRRYRQVGTVTEVRQANQDLAEYTALGTVGEIRRRLAADGATIQFLSAILAQTRQSLVLYEALLGPTLLSAFRHAGAFDTAVAALNRYRRDASPAPILNLGELVIPSAQGLSRLSPADYEISGRAALDVMAEAIANADPSIPVDVQAERRRLHDRCTRLIDQLDATRPDPDIVTFLNDLGEFDQMPPFGGSILGVSTRLPSPTHSSSTVYVSDGEGSAAAPPAPSASGSPRRSNTTSTFQRTVTSANASRPHSRTQPTLKTAGSAHSAPVVDLTSPATPSASPIRHRTQYYSQNVHVATRASWNDWCPGWPVSTTTVRPTHRTQLEQLAWKFGLFPSERVPPNHNQYRGHLLAVGGRNDISAHEISDWARSEPWNALVALVPEPITFEPADPRFAELYTKTKMFYAKAMRCYWERTHYLLVIPDAAHGTWRASRKNARSLVTPLMHAQFQLILDFFCQHPEVDPDLLLDPLFLWPPGAASVMLIPRRGETIGDAVARVDSAEPARALFLKDPSAHPSRAVLNRVRGKFFPATRPQPSIRDPPSTPPFAPAAAAAPQMAQQRKRRRLRSILDDDSEDEQPPQVKPSRAELASAAAQRNAPVVPPSAIVAQAATPSAAEVASSPVVPPAAQPTSSSTASRSVILTPPSSGATTAGETMSQGGDVSMEAASDDNPAPSESAGADSAATGDNVKSTKVYRPSAI